MQTFVTDCEDEGWSDDCELKSLASLLNLRPYVGSKRCYDPDDLHVIREYMGFRYSFSAVPFLRNEIFARKGYMFRKDLYRKFFSAQRWYKPATRRVDLNDIEKWNVDFLKAIEDGNIVDDRKLPVVYERLKATCPGNR